MNKTFVTILILVVVILGGYFLLKSSEVQAPTMETPVVPIGTANESTSVGQNAVTYSDTGYLPGTLNIKVGTTVTFKNNSSVSMWTASAFHPTHAAYPTTGGCLGSTFDACKGIQPGDFWSFKFDIVGSWKYHDHLKPSYFGTIVVK